ncbi:type I glyceraldehyde-3-phosphate dehydrogenase [Patescibacteria group bacterium]|nr:type I glyceraldehyde-3-phosphate dehydrogenase [Patescibacteria group bacterium]
MTVRIAINGFGRIGRASFKIALDKGIEVVAINDLSDLESIAHLLKYDSAYGIYQKEVSYDDSHVIVDSKKYVVLSEKEPAKLPWKEYEVDVVLECTGRFVKDNAAKAHLEAGAKGVIVSAPTKGDNNDIQTFLKGVNQDQYLGQNAISNASCTTNCVAPVTHVIHKSFKVIKSAMTTIHAVTAEQNLVDGFPPPIHKDLRRARAAITNMIPTTTGAAIATTKVIPELKDKFDGIAIRVPVLVGSLTDTTYLVEKKTTVEEVNQKFVEASENSFYKGVIAVSDKPLVSSDIVGTTYSAIVDLNMTKVIDGDFVKVLAWYDNEWGYSHRLIDMAQVISG